MQRLVTSAGQALRSEARLEGAQGRRISGEKQVHVYHGSGPMRKVLFSLVGVSLVSACAPVAAPGGGTSLGLTWRVLNLYGGVQAVLIEADGRRSASIRCQNGLLSVDVPSLKPVMGSTPLHASLQLGGQPIPLSTRGVGVMASGRPPENIAERILTANEFRFVLGHQVFGPYMPPTGAEAQVLASACASAALSQPR